MTRKRQPLNYCRKSYLYWSNKSEPQISACSSLVIGKNRKAFFLRDLRLEKACCIKGTVGQQGACAHASTCGKLRVAFGLKLPLLRTFYRQKLLTSIAAQWRWPYSASPTWSDACQLSIRIKSSKDSHFAPNSLCPALSPPQ